MIELDATHRPAQNRDPVNRTNGDDVIILAPVFDEDAKMQVFEAWNTLKPYLR